jgi:type II secretory pathway pseudopilin PulG
MKKKLVGLLAKTQLQNSKSAYSSHGFSLIELLVAIILTFLVIGPLMEFMIDLMNSDLKEEAKSTSEQEIQSALDYISQDMEQAVYIYNADGLYGTTANGVTVNGIYGTTPQIPGAGATDKTMTPVLAFWKRYFYRSSLNVTLSSGTTTTVGCLSSSLFTSSVSSGSGTATCNNQDYMVYSLVVYYLVNNGSTNATWNPNSQRIVRWEIRDGIHDPNGTQTRTENGSTVTYTLLPDHGFYPFNLSSSGNLGVQLGNWTNLTATDPYTAAESAGVALVDYIDPTPYTKLTTNTQATCLTGEEKVPSYTNVDSSFATDSFYACVNSSNYTARVYIRGNALARLQSNNTAFNTQQPLFFPTASIQVKGRGFLGIQ